MDELRLSHIAFRELVHDDVRRLLNSLPEDLVNDSWLVQCYRDLKAFETRYSDAQTRSAALQRLAELNDTAEAVRCRLAIVDFPVADPMMPEVSSEF